MAATKLNFKNYKLRHAMLISLLRHLCQPIMRTDHIPIAFCKRGIIASAPFCKRTQSLRIEKVSSLPGAELSANTVLMKCFSFKVCVYEVGTWGCNSHM